MVGWLPFDKLRVKWLDGWMAGWLDGKKSCFFLWNLAISATIIIEKPETMEYLSLEKLDAYRTAFELSNCVWDVVHAWDNFPRWTVGKQLVEATDSISANIAEGFGRYHKKDKIRHYHYSAGSTKESLDWTKKSIKRGLLNKEQASFIIEKLDALPFEINRLIKYTRDTLKY